MDDLDLSGVIVPAKVQVGEVVLSEFARLKVTAWAAHPNPIHSNVTLDLPSGVAMSAGTLDKLITALTAIRATLA